ncbi:hypothetical protein ACFL0R_01905, partial [Pseudomonadota bacterium]
NEAKSMGIDKGETGRDALIAYEHGMEKCAQGQDLLATHDYASASSHFAESNELFISAIKHGKYYLLKKESTAEQETNEKGAEQATFEYE